MEASLCISPPWALIVTGDRLQKWPLGLIVPIQDPTPFSPFLPGDWPESLGLVRSAGYSCVELAITHPSHLQPSQLEVLLGKTDLKWVSVTTGQAFWKEALSLSSPNEKVREQALMRVKAHMDLASPFGAVVIIGLIRGKEGEKTFLMEALRECADFRKNVRLALEPLNRYETSLLNTVAEVMEFIEVLNRENVGILFDTFHANIEEASIAAAILLAKDRLFHVHVADSNRWIPGFGHLDFSEVWEALDKVNYKGGLVLECLPKPDARFLFRPGEVKKRVGLELRPA